MSHKSRPKRDVEAALLAKGFVARSSDHNYFHYYSESGEKTRIKTKTSFGHKPKDIQGDLIRNMAGQCALTVEQFLGLIDCPLSRSAYEQLLVQKGHVRS